MPYWATEGQRDRPNAPSYDMLNVNAGANKHGSGGGTGCSRTSSLVQEVPCFSLRAATPSPTVRRAFADTRPRAARARAPGDEQDPALARDDAVARRRPGVGMLGARGKPLSGAG